LEWLSENRTVLRLQDFAELHRRRELPAGAVAVTIDDGYACNSDVAAPLLEEYRVPATLFLPVNVIEQAKPFWWDELEAIVLGHKAATLTLDGRTISLGERSPADRQWTPRSTPRTTRQQAFYDLHVLLARKRPVDLERAMAELRRQAAAASPTGKRPMTREEIRRSASPYVEFGSHALNHPWLPSLDVAEQRHEICDSIGRCRSLTGSAPSSFAYPFGMFDEQSEQLVMEAGFQCACTTGDLAVSRRSRTFALPRIQVSDWDAAGLERALARIRAA
jgi:peptidoglycan/xylan/chitin deacetylase (PgdA/CDA1 family)